MRTNTYCDTGFDFGGIAHVHCDLRFRKLLESVANKFHFLHSSNLQFLTLPPFLQKIVLKNGAQFKSRMLLVVLCPDFLEIRDFN